MNTASVQRKPVRGFSMCGRFARIVSSKKLREKYRLKEIAELEPRYNIAPTQPVAVVRAAEGGNELSWLRWGLIPSWSKESTNPQRGLTGWGVSFLMSFGSHGIACIASEVVGGVVSVHGSRETSATWPRFVYEGAATDVSVSPGSKPRRAGGQELRHSFL